MTKPFVGIRGVNHVNLGAELIWKAAKERLAGPDLDVRANIRIARTTTEVRGGCWYLPSPIGGLLHRAPVRQSLFRDLSEAVAIIDGSGFGYGDFWGPTPSRRSIRQLSYGTAKLVVLPQAFGPFTDEVVRRWTSAYLSLADLVGVRDPVSFDHIVGLGLPDSVRLLRVPDIVLDRRLWKIDTSHQSSGVAVLCPTSRVAESGGDPEQYFSGIRDIGRFLTRQGCQVRVGSTAVHEDGEIVQRLGRELALSPSNVESSENLPLDWLSGADLVVSSRYHALVVALAHHVPVLSLGWTHKYRTLLDLFGQGNFALDASTSADTMVGQTEELLMTLPDARATIRNHDADVQASLDSYWNAVRDVLSARSSVPER